MSDTAVHRPIDYVLIEFPGDRVTGAVADTLMDLVERGIIRVYDLLVIRKADDGSFSGIDISDVSADHRRVTRPLTAVLTEDEFAAQKARILAS